MKGAVVAAACATLAVACPASAAGGKLDFSPGKVTPGGALLVEGGKLELRLEPQGKGKAVRVFGEPGAKGAPVIVSAKAKPGRYDLVGCEGRKCDRAKGTVKVVKPKPKPLEVAPQPEVGAARSARIGPEGGTITATAGDGSLLSLVIPENALTAPEAITLTPLGGLEGQPLDFVAGAEIGPSGLRLLREATLTIDPPGRIRDPVGFGYSGATNEFAMTPSTEKGGALTVPLTHFSGGAMLDARPAEWIKVGPYLPSSAHQEAQKRLAESLEVPGDASDAALVEALGEWYRDRVKPRLELAQTSDTIFEDAIAEARAWERFVQIVSRAGAFSRQISELNELLRSAISKAFDRSVVACQGHQDVFFHGRRLLFLPRLGAVLDLEIPLDPSEYSRCLRFELDVEGELALRDWAPFGTTAPERIDSRARYAVRGLPIAVDANGIPVGGKPAPDLLEEAITATRGNNCRFSDPRFLGGTRFTPGPETQGTNTGFDLDPNLGQGNFLLEDRIQLTGGFTGLLSTLECTDGGTSFVSHGGSLTFNLAMQALYEARGMFTISGGSSFVVRDWQVFEGSAHYAQKQVSRTVALNNLGTFWADASESTSWVLRHTPG